MAYKFQLSEQFEKIASLVLKGISPREKNTVTLEERKKQKKLEISSKALPWNHVLTCAK